MAKGFATLVTSTSLLRSSALFPTSSSSLLFSSIPKSSSLASYLAIPFLVLVLAASALVPSFPSTSALSFPDLTALTVILGVDVSHFRSVLVPVLPSVKVSSFLGVET